MPRSDYPSARERISRYLDETVAGDNAVAATIEAVEAVDYASVAQVLIDMHASQTMTGCRICPSSAGRGLCQGHADQFADARSFLANPHPHPSPTPKSRPSTTPRFPR
jgi:hypothetical protein